jgi:hypothetical protein
MTKRPRITTVEQADAAMTGLRFLQWAGHPNTEVRLLWECAVAYRAAVHRQEQGEQKRPGFVDRVTK